MYHKIATIFTDTIEHATIVSSKFELTPLFDQTLLQFRWWFVARYRRRWNTSFRPLTRLDSDLQNSAVTAMGEKKLVVSR